ncbi:MAG: hypothetical protein OMM_10597 [Candidatus Magnetoglobus multicellularis str. Araruama]|uniref:Asparagine synthetase domain-containing protein n=1 Tax=Candidatus Magnetoglobus multicellularis str. Araruama TaxID=890399 RepID=A0A1V1P0M3_9BACT|nr:MAG: hypothetical protein OMM_10597 [Candidatus Magnetoglobus multicellularis str. Araruama]
MSGGMDSASVVAMGRTNAQTIQTFSIGFQERSFDESPYSKFLSKYFKTRHYHDILSLEKSQKYAAIINQQTGRAHGRRLLCTHSIALPANTKKSDCGIGW